MSPIDEQRQLRIRVDWFKPSGKWYAGGVVDIGLTRLHHDTFCDAIRTFQKELLPGWENEDWWVVTSDLPEYDNDPEYRLFNLALFHSSSFRVPGHHRAYPDSHEGGN